MDINASDPKTLDIPYRVKSLSFRYFNESEGVKLSVCRIVSSQAFNEIGLPLPRGLYDPALGPTSIRDGPCVTCGQSYISCPGHFGHIELPFPVANPLLKALHLKLMRSSCAYCYKLRLSNFDRDLYLARLYFEDAGHPHCSFAVEAYRFLHQHKQKSFNSFETAIDGDEEADAAANSNQGGNVPLITNWQRYFDGLPKPLSSYLSGLDGRNVDTVHRNIMRAARLTWRKACEKGQLLPARSKGWREITNMLFASTYTSCPHCQSKPMKFRKAERSRIFRKPDDSKIETLLSCTEHERHIAGLWANHFELFDLLFGLKGRRKHTAEDERTPHRHLFVRNVLVPPSRFRPTSMAGGQAAEHPQNVFYQTLLEQIQVIMDAKEVGIEDDSVRKKRKSLDADLILNDVQKPVKRQPTKTQYANAMLNIQQALHLLYDSSQSSSNSDLASTGIRQQIEKKAGLFRQHMMGKRVNYSCRSVIGPDVFLDTDEIGIPESFAKQLTIPEPVTPRNVESMRRAVLNGPDVYPGATEVEDVNSNGEVRVTKLRASDEKMRNAQAGLLLQNRLPKANGFGGGGRGHSSKMDLDDDMGGGGSSMQVRSMPKRVRRHLKTGDVVLFNRQPTLHRVSIMAHRVRVLPGDRTIRFHYANCGSYNADFDGDEMNVHIPQDYLGRAEAEELMLSSKHYIVPTSGAPIRGLIQDHIAAATLLSRRDTFLDRNMFVQLLYAATEKIMLRPSRIGQKYVIPMPAIIKPVPLWTGKQLISTILSVVRNGRPGLQLNSGTKTKPLVVGPEESRVVFRQGELLQGVIDKASLGSSMYGIVHGVQEAYGCRASDDFLTSIGRLCLHYMRFHGHTTGVSDLELQDAGDRKRCEIISAGIESIGVEAANSVYTEMSTTGELTKKAKNKKQACRLIEEIVRKYGAEAEDRLDTAMNSALGKVSTAVMKASVPVLLRRRFPDNGFALMTNTGAKGGPVNAAQISCLLGSTVLEGKRVPRMGGSGATLPCFTPYDPSPIAGGFIASRFLTGITPQEFFFHAMSGREGLLDTSLKTANSGYLQRCLVKHLEALRVHYDGSVRDSDNSVLQFIYGEDGIDPCKSRWLIEKIDWQVNNRKCLEVTGERTDEDVERIRDRRKVLKSNGEELGGTLLEDISPAALNKRGAISEKFDSLIQSVEKTRTGNAKARQFLEGRYQWAAVEPGEAVGVTAAQGVGEPSTQMTLNTFHHAGSSSAHVTLGIPRLRELLMTASKYPKTPSMTLPILKETGRDGALKLRQKLQKIRLLDLMMHLEVYEKSVVYKPDIMNFGAIRTVTVALYFPEEALYEEEIGLKFSELVRFIQQKFIQAMGKKVVAEMKRIIKDGGSRMSRKAARFYIRTTNEDRVVDNLMEATGHPRIRAGEHVGEEGEDIDVEYGDGGDEMEMETQADGDEVADSSDEEDEDDDDGDNDDGRGDEKQEDEEDDGTNELYENDNKRKSNERTNSKNKKSSKRQRSMNGDRDRPSEKIIFENVAGSEFCGMGYLGTSLRTEGDTLVMFDWVLPFEACGKLDFSAVVHQAAECPLIEVEHISRCFESDEGDELAVITEGSNVPAVFSIGHDVVDFKHMETNDMFAILNTYGVEALRAALIKEFVKVFSAYGDPVNIRHLQLLADYMTAQGGYRAFNRRSIDDCPSPFQRMTFETSVSFLLNDALNASEEDMKNPSAALALSTLTESGSGGFQLVQQI